MASSNSASITSLKGIGIGIGIGLGLMRLRSAECAKTRGVQRNHNIPAVIAIYIVDATSITTSYQVFTLNFHIHLPFLMCSLVGFFQTVSTLSQLRRKHCVKLTQCVTLAQVMFHMPLNKTGIVQTIFQ